MKENSYTSAKNGSFRITKHVRPNVSCIEPYRGEVALAREGSWPYPKIAVLLKERHDLDVSPRTICDFCLRRNIEKGVGETRVKPRIETYRTQKHASMTEGGLTRVATGKKKGGFTYDDDGPLRTIANGLLNADGTPKDGKCK